jgi:hypothetical protein
VIAPVQDSYAELEYIGGRYGADSSEKRFRAWLEAIDRYCTRKNSTIIDIAVNAASLAHSIAENPARLNDPLIAAAIRDTNPNFDFANPPTGQALEGAVNAAKGKYFEYLVVDKLEHHERVGDVVLPPDCSAKLARSMTQPGWDVQIVDRHGHVMDYLQLKATDQLSYIKEALHRYPGISVLTTDDALYPDQHLQHVLNSNINGQLLDDAVRETMASASDETFANALIGSFHPLLSLGFILATEGYRVVVKKKDIARAVLSAAHRSTRSVTSQAVGALVYAAGGGWCLAVPASILTGQVYERLAALYEASELIEQATNELMLLRVQQQEVLLQQ